VTIDSSPHSSTRLFVYGTLKRGQPRAHYLRNETFLGKAVTCPQYRLVNCGDYPGLVSSDAGIAIQGELWEVSRRCLQILDNVEGVPFNLYQRAEIQLQQPWNSEPTITYLYQPDVTGLPDCGACW